MVRGFRYIDSALRTGHLKKSLVVAVTDGRANDQILPVSYPVTVLIIPSVSCRSSLCIVSMSGR